MSTINTYYTDLTGKIVTAIKADPDDLSAYSDLFAVIHQWSSDPDELDPALDCNSDTLRPLLGKQLNVAIDHKDWAAAEVLHDLLFKSLVLGARHSFEDYLQAVEFKRDNDKKFYSPRRVYLKPIIDAYQDVAEGKYQLLTVSLPKRSGKSQTGINFINWMSGRRPNGSSLMEGTGDDLVKSFYTGCLEYLLEPNDYCFKDIFPEAPLTQTNADTKIINLGERSRFPTIMCRSIDSRQVGLSEATNVLYLDDCVEGREEAKNRMRLDQKWEVISGDVMGRALEGTPIVMCGTRYSLYDPIGRMQEYATQQGWKWKAIEVPALDPVTDESNYEFYNPKIQRMMFTTKYFRDQRDLITAEQFESEFQQQPFEAKGVLFPKDQLNTYFNLPADVDPDAIVAFCDTAERGSDYTSMPVAYIYGTEVYIADVVFDDAPPESTKPQVARCLVRNGVTRATFESNNAGEYFARDVNDLVQQMGGTTSIKTKRTISNKQTRIEVASDNILKHFWFKHPTTYERNSQYAEFMKNVTTYTRSGKVPHDDAPDSLAMLENGLRTLTAPKVEVFQRPF